MGNDPQGNPYLNQITDKEKQLVREIFDVLGLYAGIVFSESSAGGTRIAKGDLRALRAEAVNGPGGIAGLGGGGAVMLDALEGWTSDVWGGDFFGVMFHEIGHAVSLGHSYDLPSLMGAGIGNGVYPGDVDIVHLNRLHPPFATDIDLYQFKLEAGGRFTAEVRAERQSSQLNSVLTLFNANGEVVARNDDYYGNDSFLDLQLDAGTYYVGVTSTGNTDYDPRFRTRDQVARRMALIRSIWGSPSSEVGTTLTDSRGTGIDGDADGTPGGKYQFWFESSDHALIVDKVRDLTANQVEGVGSISDPYDTISAALDDARLRVIIPATGGAALHERGFHPAFRRHLGPEDDHVPPGCVRSHGGNRVLLDRRQCRHRCQSSCRVDQSGV